MSLRTYFCLFLSLAAPLGHAKGEGAPITTLGSGLLISDCRIGEDSGKCLWDTGSDTSFVSQTLASMRLPLARQANATCAGSRTTTIDLVRVPWIQVDALAAVGVTVARTNLYEGLPAYLGVLGSDVLSQTTRVIFDLARLFDSKIARLYANSQVTPVMLKAFSTFGKIVPGPKLAIEVTVNGIPAVAQWDTHAPTMVSQSFVAKHPDMFVKKDTQEVGNVCGGNLKVTSYDMNSQICLDQVCINAPTLSDYDNSADGSAHYDFILGIDAINQMTWYFNFETNQYSARVDMAP